MLALCIGFAWPAHAEWQTIVLHHVASDAKRAKCHIVVSREGDLTYTKVWNLGEPTSHVFRQSRAPGAIALCLEGNLDASKVSANQAKVAAKVVSELKAKYGLGVKDVRTHREIDGRTTTCPGKNLDKIALLTDAGLLEGQTLSVRVDKGSKWLAVLAGSEEVLGFDITAGPRKGGMKSLPSGSHEICQKDEGTAFHRYIALCEPGQKETAVAIHGGGDALHFDWTMSCFALRDSDMDLLFRAVPVKAAVVVED